MVSFVSAASPISEAEREKQEAEARYEAVNGGSGGTGEKKRGKPPRWPAGWIRS